MKRQKLTISICNNTQVTEQPVDEHAQLVCTLRIPDNQTKDNLVPVYVMGFKIHHRAMDMESMEDDLHLEGSRVPLALNIRIQDVLKPFGDGFFYDGIAIQNISNHHV